MGMFDRITQWRTDTNSGKIVDWMSKGIHVTGTVLATTSLIMSKMSLMNWGMLLNGLGHVHSIVNDKVKTSMTTAHSVLMIASAGCGFADKNKIAHILMALGVVPAYVNVVYELCNKYQNGKISKKLLTTEILKIISASGMGVAGVALAAGGHESHMSDLSDMDMTSTMGMGNSTMHHNDIHDMDQSQEEWTTSQITALTGMSASLTAELILRLIDIYEQYPPSTSKTNTKAESANHEEDVRLNSSS